MEIDYQKLDLLLAELYKGDGQYAVAIAETYLELFKPSDRYSREFARYMVELRVLGLAKDRRGVGTVMDITPFGHQVHRAGGWIAYNDQKSRAQQKEQLRQEKEQQLREREVTATVDSAKSSESSKRAAWVSARASWISAFFSALALVLTVLQHFDSQQKEEVISRLERQIAILERQVATLDARHRIPDRTILNPDPAARSADSARSAGAAGASPPGLSTRLQLP